MKHLKVFSVPALVLVLALAFTGSQAVLAEEGTDSQSESTTSTTSTTTTETSQTGGSSKRVQKIEQHTQQRVEKVEQRGEKRIENVEQRQADREAKKTERRQKFCEAHKQGLTTKFSHIVTNSQRIQTRIDGILDKALAYQQTNNLKPENFDTLMAAAQTAKANSAASIAALQSVTPTLDCNSGSVASDVKAFKAAAATTRDNLKAYRSAVKAVLQALQAAKPATAEGSAE